MTDYTLFGQPGSPASLVADTSGYTLGVQFSVSSAATFDGIWFYSAPGAGALPSNIALGNVAAVNIPYSESASWSGAAASGWVFAAFASPPALSASVSYKAAVYYAGGVNWYSVTSHDWDSGAHSGGVSNGPLSAPNNAGGDGGQDTFYVGAFQYPNGSFNAGNYWVDPQVTVSGAALATPAPVVAPSAAAVQAAYW